MAARPNESLFESLLPAYSPCTSFGRCPGAIWHPARGQVPRGFVGATGALSEVEVIMVFAEPGHPYEGEGYDPLASGEEILMQTVNQTYRSVRDGRDLFHRNIRWFLNRLFPGQSLDLQLRRAWLTESRLCSMPLETGGLSDRMCANRYLSKQLALMPQAMVVAFGAKAANAMRDLRREWIRAYALAPPGANHQPARPSWEAAIAAIEARR